MVNIALQVPPVLMVMRACLVLLGSRAKPELHPSPVASCTPCIVKPLMCRSAPAERTVCGPATHCSSFRATPRRQDKIWVRFNYKSDFSKRSYDSYWSIGLILDFAGCRSPGQLSPALQHGPLHVLLHPQHLQLRQPRRLQLLALHRSRHAHEYGEHFRTGH